MTIKTRHGRKRNGNVKTFPPELLKKLPPPAPAQERPEPDTLGAKIDNRIDERFDGETTRSSLAILLSAFAVVMAAVAAITIVFVAGDDGSSGTTQAPVATAAAATIAAAPAADISAAAGKGIDFEVYQRPDPALPAPPAGEVKRFEVDVYEHVTKVKKDLAPTRVWSYAVNGKEYRGTGVSAPMVVTQGDRVEMTLINGGSQAMDVKMPHSIDFHSSEVAPNVAFKTIAPGENPGVFMYHCATPPVLMHTGAGMMGMMVVKPRDLAPVDRELWVTQQEFFLGQPGKDADMGKMEAKNPDVIAFNGYADQYKDKPIAVKRGERIRMYVLNAGPSEWSAFHVIGTVFDRTVVEGTVGRSSQTVNLAPSQGGWVEFTLDKEGTYPFVTHAFGDMVKGATGVLATEGAPTPKPGEHKAH